MQKLLFFFLAATFSLSAQTTFTYPVTKKVKQVDDYFGEKIEDPYRWLEDDKSEETKVWVTEQNKVTYSYLEQIPFRDKIKKTINRHVELQ